MSRSSAYAQLQVNSFTLSSPSLSPIGVAMSPLIAMANHSCDPNAVVVFPEGGGAMRVVAIRDILPGDEVSTGLRLPLLRASISTTFLALMDRQGNAPALGTCSMANSSNSRSPRPTSISHLRTIIANQSYWSGIDFSAVAHSAENIVIKHPPRHLAGTLLCRHHGLCDMWVV
jgi:hypothetical protein